MPRALGLLDATLSAAADIRQARRGLPSRHANVASEQA